MNEGAAFALGGLTLLGNLLRCSGGVSPTIPRGEKQWNWPRRTCPFLRVDAEHERTFAGHRERDRTIERVGFHRGEPTQAPKFQLRSGFQFLEYLLSPRPQAVGYGESSDLLVEIWRQNTTFRVHWKALPGSPRKLFEATPSQRGRGMLIDKSAKSAGSGAPGGQGSSQIPAGSAGGDTAVSRTPTQHSLYPGRRTQISKMGVPGRRHRCRWLVPENSCRTFTGRSGQRA